MLHFFFEMIIAALNARDGSWGNWSPWTNCTRGCEGGSRSRYRFCNHPFPAHGGKDCDGIGTEKEKCNTQKCPGKLGSGLLRVFLIHVVCIGYLVGKLSLLQ